MDNEIKSWLAFAAQKVVEVNALAKALAGHKDDVSYLCVCVLKLLVPLWWLVPSQ